MTFNVPDVQIIFKDKQERPERAQLVEPQTAGVLRELELHFIWYSCVVLCFLQQRLWNYSIRCESQ